MRLRREKKIFAHWDILTKLRIGEVLHFSSGVGTPFQ